MQFQKEINQGDIITQTRTVEVIEAMRLEFDTLRYFMYGVLLPLINEVENEETLLILFKLKQKLWEKQGLEIVIMTDEIKLMIASIDKRMKHCSQRKKEIDEINIKSIENTNGLEYTVSATSFKTLSFRQESYDNMTTLREMLFNALFTIPTFK